MSDLILKTWPRWLDKKLASVYTSYSIRQIDRFIRSGLIPHCRLDGGNVRIDIKDLDRLMETSKIDIQKSVRRATRRAG